MDSCIARGIRISSRNTARVVRKTPFVFSRGNSSATKAKSMPAPSKAKPEAAVAELTWPKYLAIKRSKRTWQTVSQWPTKVILNRVNSCDNLKAVAIPSSLAGLAGGALYFGNLDTDPTKLILVWTYFFLDRPSLSASCRGLIPSFSMVFVPLEPSVRCWEV